MIDHVLGRPSSKSRRLQVLAVLSFWTVYLYRGHKHGPPGARALSRALSRRLTAWQTFLMTMMYLYAARNFSALVGLASPEPMANMYDAAFFRATWVLTALDAGFWTAMRIRSRRLRDLASIVFSLFYLVAAERADEKVRKVRGMLTVDHLRVSWNKGTTPYLGFVQRLLRPRFSRWPPRQMRIPRPPGSDYEEPVAAWLYFDGPVADVARHSRVVVDIPGGGFVAMDPRCNDDRLLAWASHSGLPILSLDYRKAPEFPYPYALNECFDVYATIVGTRGRCLGMSGRETPRVVFSGDSAGGNLAVAATLMVLETAGSLRRPAQRRARLPPPDGLICFYPALDMNIGNWMSDEQMSLIRDRKMRKTNQSVVRRTSMQFDELVGAPHHVGASDKTPPPLKSPADGPPNADACHPEFSHSGPQSLQGPPVPPEASKPGSGSLSHHAAPMRTRLATSSMISYFNDRLLTPELMRAMIILYIGAHNRPDFARDYLLSPVLAPEALLARFPRTVFVTGERDPLVDDTVIFAGRLRRAKEAAGGGPDAGAAEVVLIPGISHGFMQFPSAYPPAWKHIARSAVWIEQLFADAEHARLRAKSAASAAAAPEPTEPANGPGRQQQAPGESSGDEDKPLEISMTKLNRGRGAPQPQQPQPQAKGPDGGAETASSPPAKAKGKKALGKKDRSLVKLDSSEDLLGRRMHGLASGLTGPGDED